MWNFKNEILRNQGFDYIFDYPKSSFIKIFHFSDQPLMSGTFTFDFDLA